MKQFQLSRQPQGQTLTKFHVLDSANSIIGIITVPNEAADDLQKHWLGGAPQPRAAAAGKQNRMVTAMVEASGRNRLGKAAVLRGC
jgi:hypothetical protein